MGDPDEKLFVLLAEGMEEFVWLDPRHAGTLATHPTQFGLALRIYLAHGHEAGSEAQSGASAGCSDELPPLELAQDDRRVRLW